MRDKRVFENLLDVIGNTPLVRIKRITAGLPFPVWAKLEFLNPMGSCKDRIAKYLIEEAEKDGRIHPGDVILENSSGNTAMGLALAAIQKGYTLKAVVRDRTSKEKLDQLTALGVDVVRVDTSLPPSIPTATTASPPAWPKRPPTAISPTSTTTARTTRPTTGAPAPRCGSRWTGILMSSWPAWAPAAPSAAWAAT